MARLNEPMVAPDGIELLRRKFLRQNRDIARVNSTQSLRIRSLENECARMLSENLDLRGQVLRLETELQESRAQRIADHALEIKEKMEAQLLEWGSMLASLGHEPIPKNRSPRISKKAKTRSSLGPTSPSQWRRRDTRESEAAAAQEGRLPPLWENRPCPRETLNREEILALCSEAAKTTESPDLGPPPISRFVDEDPVKIDLPTKPSAEGPVTTSLVEESLLKVVPKAEPKLGIDTEPRADAALKAEPTPAPTVQARDDASQDNPTTKKKEPRLTKPAAVPTTQASAQVAKAGLKRKIVEDEDKENHGEIRPLADTTKSNKSQPDKPARLLDRPIKELPSVRRDARGRATGTSVLGTQRKPLAARSANEVLSSPQKSTKPVAVDQVAKAKAEIKHNEQRTKPKKKEEAAAPIEVPAPDIPTAPTVTAINLEPETLTAEPNLSAPESPEPSVPCEEIRDTPPPSDISSKGETARGSRRARTAVSYAEPNLRDKMRRPTKQLFDAVSGEGKAIRRTSHSKGGETPGGPASTVKSEERSERSASWKVLPVADSASEGPASPLADKVLRRSPDHLPMNVVTDRKKRNPSMAVQGTESEGVKPATKSTLKPSTNRRLDDIAAREAEVARMFDESDVYEFTSSPSNESKRTNPEEDKKAKSSRHARSRRLSSVVCEDIALDPVDTSSKGAKPNGARKRASMVALKNSILEADNSGRNSPAEGDSLSSSSPADADGSARDRASMRRRSMML
ncbi:uncharacterized protein BCR38DRAFT_409777 [Pseudomassariella vexata]|uniref:Shugoshin n=1 Tax=Pseudomassariella vexata TaxID=1141098 RepID=A0A1Y2DYM7_9PEZI|nr:uncharacterized protein BCR38DRAFT_409777 [Pseudomassariella vexata]ORY64408.1 hypothetical protein BCR38DRAFT_409777 [Pseudomassariella vexata]